MPGWGFFIFGKFLLHPFKKVFGNDGRDAIRHYNVPINILPDIAPVVQKMLYTVVVKGQTAVVFHSMLIQPITNLRHGSTLIVTLEGFQHKRGC